MAGTRPSSPVVGAGRLAAVVSLALVAMVPASHAGAATADDPVFAAGLQWGLERIGAPAAWDRTRGQGVTIAVVDSGVDLAHEDLAGKVEGAISCIGASGDPQACGGSGQDDNGHGTHVAGIALAATDNQRGIAGVAPDARLLAVRVLANECSGGTCTATGTAGDVAAGIRWAADQGADVINLSLGGGAVQATLGCAFCDAVEYAWSKGAIPVIAAGNDAVLPAGFGDEPAVVVTATTRDDTRSSYSNSSSGVLREARWPVSAPGGEGETDARDCAPGGTPKGILSTYWISGQTNSYACLAGTSMAAPHVSGALALLRSMGLSPQQAVDRLLGTVTDLGQPGRDPLYGMGRIDVAKATSGAPADVTSTTEPITPATAPPPGDGPPATAAPPTTTPPVTMGPPGPGEPALPGSDQAAPFPPEADPDEARAEGWLVAVAVAALLASGALTSAVAWRQGSGPLP